jgi:hypothetical protein
MQYTAIYDYDIETLHNLFTIVIIRESDSATWKFEISQWMNQGIELYQLLMQIKMSKGRMRGYNNLGYDYPILHMLIEYQGIVNNALLKNKNDAIFASQGVNDYEHFIWENERHIPQIDLYRIHHFDNKAKRTSLKLLEFNMMLSNIDELELDFQALVKDRTEADRIMEYNHSDAKATAIFGGYSRSELAFRDELSIKYGKDFTNHNDTKIGQDFFVMELAKKGIRANKYNQTIRAVINVGEVILPYIKFDTPGFQEVLEFFRETVIDPEQIKGFFGSRDKTKSKCTANITERLADTMDPKDVRVHYMDGTRTTYDKIDRNKPVKYLRPVNIHTVVNGFRFDFGAGGIHGSLHNTIVVPDSTQTLRDSDVASYYPNLSIANNFFPFHLGAVFCAVYLGIYNQRKTYAKGTPENNMLKLALNGVYGKSNDKHSPFYDPQYTMSITINGQLLLCMLAEQLMKIPGLTMVQINTDGLTYLCPNEYVAHADAISKWWEQLTKLELEHVDYIKMAVRDVNSYLAVTKPYMKKGVLVPPKIKRIGAYAYERASENPGSRELPWHKNHSGVVIAKAAEAALVRGDNIERFIRAHIKTNPLDFMMRTKVNRADDLYLETPITVAGRVITTTRKKIQNVTRYYVTNSGGKLIKQMDPTTAQNESWNVKPHWRHKVSGIVKQSAKAPSGMFVQCKPPSELPPVRRLGICAGQFVTEANKLSGLDMSDVNIKYYVDETRKLVDALVLV